MGSDDRRTLGDYFTLQRGTTYKSRLLDAPGPVLLGLATIQRNGGFRTDSLRTYGGDSPAKLLVQPGDLFLSLKDVTQSADLLGAVAKLPVDHTPGRLTQDTVKLEPKRADVPLDYLYWLLRTPQYRSYCRAHATGTTNLGLARQDFLAFPAPEPSPIQRKIVETLGTLEDKIELNRRRSQTLESMARALFKSWFVDFDPVRAKAEGCEPDLPAHLSDLFPNSFADSDIGLVPDDWNVGTLADVLSEMETGGRPKGGVAGYDHGVASVGAESIVGLGIFDYAKTKYVPGEFFDGMTKGRVKNGDVLLYKDGGRPGLFEPHSTLVGDGFPFERFAINEHVYRLRAIQDYGQSLLFFWLASDFAEAEMRVRGTGVAIPGLNSVQLKSLTTLIPTAAVSRVFSALVDPLVGSILANGRECRELSQLRELLLPELLAGEVGRQAYATASVRTSSEARRLPSLEGGRQQ